jgi:predicted RNA-binding Zn-ribbon protein involved in translation (DUF1610 family)
MSEIDQSLFARITGALLECPGCGELWDIRAGAWQTGKQRGGRKHQAGLFDPLTARFGCPSCGLRAVLGLVLYLVDEGETDPQPPKDWKAGVRQRAQLRVQRAGGRLSGESWRERRRWRGANQIRGGNTNGK